MILSDGGIKQALEKGDLEIDPLPQATQYTSSAVDLTLGNQFQGWDYSRFRVKGVKVELNLAEQSYVSTATAYLKAMTTEPDGSFIFAPYAVDPVVLLANTRERVHLKRESKLAARVEGRSSLARIGLTVHLTAPTIHSGFAGNITLELINHSPFYIRMVPGCVICQLIVERLESESMEQIKTAFQNQRDPSGLR